MPFFPHAFTGLVEAHDLGRYRYTVVWLPEALAEQLPLQRHPRLRISGEINEHPLSGAWQPSRGRWYLMLGKPLLRTTGLSLDCLAEVRFRVEPQDEVEVPSGLDEAIARDECASARWQELSAGKQRALCHFVGAARSTTTQAKRIDQAIAWLSCGETDIRRLPRMH